MITVNKVRIQKFLADAGICSRRKAEEYITQGRVAVDGRKITEMGCIVDPASQRITFDNQPVLPTEKKVYILLNKPKGYVTTLHDPQGRPIVTTLLVNVSERVFPVGRLDLDTEGALLLTNDGSLTHRIIHPRHEITKTYEAMVKGNPSPARLEKLTKGIMLEGRLTAPARLAVLQSGGKTSTIEIIIREGRKRQVRKMFAAIGHPVVALKRTAYGSLRLGKLEPGGYRFLDKKDLDKIFS